MDADYIRVLTLTNLPLISNKAFVKKSHIHGYGVFAAQNIAKGEVIEECYFLEQPHLTKSLEDYYFGIGDMSVLPLGNGCIYNHSDQANASFDFNTNRSIMVITAKQDIEQDEEIFLYYSETWFSSRDRPVIRPPLKYRLRRYFPLFKLVLRFGMVLLGILLVLALSTRMRMLWLG